MMTSSTQGDLQILAIDVGSSSARSEVFDARLQPVSGTFCQQTYTLQTGLDGRAELSPDRLTQTVTDCIDHSLRSVEHVDAVGMSCFWHSIMGVDRHGVPTTNVLMWADTRAAVAVERLSRQLDLAQHHQSTGTRLHASYPLAKLRWIYDSCHDVASRTHRWMSFPEYLQEEFAGIASVSISMASGTGLFDRRGLIWNANALRHAGIDAGCLNAIDDSPLTLNRINRWPQLADAVWFPAIGDGAANNLGSDAVDASHPALMVGTTGAMRLVTNHPPDQLPARLWQYRLDRKHALLGGALSEGGGVIAWLADNLRTPQGEELDRQIRRTTPDTHGLTVLPYLAGERSPGWHSDATGTVHGLRFDTSPLDIMQATMESIGYSFAAILDDLKPLLKEPVEVIATGNGLRMNRAWIQMIADILGYPLLLPRQTEASLRGAAMHAMRQLGVEPPIGDFTSDVERFEPDPDRTESYDQARQRQRLLYDRLIGKDSILYPG